MESPRLNKLGYRVRGPDKGARFIFRPSRQRTKYWTGPQDGRTLRGQPPHRLPTKLTAPQVAWIKGVLRLDRKERRRPEYKRRKRYRCSPGLYQRLAEKFNVTIWCIESIDRGRRWRKVKALVGVHRDIKVRRNVPTQPPTQEATR